MTADGLRFETGVATDVGRHRSENEDACLVYEEAGLWAVADGMGGHQDGALASASIIEALRAMAPATSAADLLGRCEKAALLANTRIRQLSPPGAIMGTTVVALLTHKADFACIWSGDSRLYLIRDGAIEQWTEDHTEVQELLSSGAITPEQALTWPRRNVVTRAIGVFDAPELDIRAGTLRPGDTFVLCSDGLTNHVGPVEIRDHVAAPPQEAADALVRLTLDRDASDNVTVVVVRCLVAREQTVVLPLLAGRSGEAVAP